MPATLPQRRSHAAAGALVLALHALALLTWLHLGVARDRAAPGTVQMPLMPQLPLMLQWLRDVPQAVAPAPVRLPLLPGATLPRRTVDRVSALPSGGTPLQPASVPNAATEPQAPAPPAPPPAATAAPPGALDLTLPRAASAAWRERPPPMSDSRANTPRATFESRLAAAMGGDGSWVREPLGNGGDATHVRYRRGTLCIDVYKARVARLDPWNQSFSPTPAQMSGAQPC